jgi:hypothetical protein
MSDESEIQAGRGATVMDWYAFVGPVMGSVMIIGLFGMIFLIVIDARSVPTYYLWRDLDLPPERDLPPGERQGPCKRRHAPSLRMKEAHSPAEAVISTAPGAASPSMPMRLQPPVAGTAHQSIVVTRSDPDPLLR